MEYSKWQKALAEFIGPLALVFVGGGAGIIASFGAGASGLVTVGLAHGLVIATMVTAVGHISGGHLNPAVTIGAWVTQKISSSLALIYIVAQLAGGIAGALLLRAALPQQLWKPSNLGATTVVRGISSGQAILIEAILTFFLVWVVFGVAIDGKGSWSKVAGLPIGLVIAMGAFMGGPLTGASMNPARSLGPAVISGHFTGLWVYFVGPIAGGIIAAALYDGVFLRLRGDRALDEDLDMGEDDVMETEPAGELPAEELPAEELPVEEQQPGGWGAHDDDVGDEHKH